MRTRGAVHGEVTSRRGHVPARDSPRRVLRHRPGGFQFTRANADDGTAEAPRLSYGPQKHASLSVVCAHARQMHVADSFNICRPSLVFCFLNGLGPSDRIPEIHIAELPKAGETKLFFFSVSDFPSVIESDFITGGDGRWQSRTTPGHSCKYVLRNPACRFRKRSRFGLAVIPPSSLR